MDSIISILIAVIAIVGVIILLMQLSSRKSTSVSKDTYRQKGRQAIIREAMRKLNQDAHNSGGLKALSSLYFEEHLWDFYSASHFRDVMREIPFLSYLPFCSSGDFTGFLRCFEGIGNLRNMGGIQGRIKKRIFKVLSYSEQTNAYTHYAH